MTSAHVRLTDETVSHAEFGELRRVQAAVDLPFHGVRSGQRGGWMGVEGGASLSGRGWLGDDAILAEEATLTDEAVVSGRAVLRGRSRVAGRSSVSGAATIAGSAVVRGHARVGGSAHVGGRARLSDRVRVDHDAWCEGDFQIDGEVRIDGRAVLLGGATLSSASDLIVIGPFGPRMYSIALFRGPGGSVSASCRLAWGDLEDVVTELTTETERFMEPLLDPAEAEALRELASRLLVR